MKKLLMTMVLVVCAVGGSAQGLRPRRTLGSRLQRPVASAPKEQKTCVRTTTANGVEWTYEVVGDGVFLGSCDKGALSVRPDKKAKLAVPQNTSGTIVIPETFAGIPVRGIGAGAFSCCSNLTLVTIPSSVTSIGSDAFRDCRELMSVTIPSSVTSVGDRAFEGCRGLTSVAIPSCKTHIGHEAFRGCGSVKDVVISGCVGGIDLSQVTNLVVAEGTTRIAGAGAPGNGVFPFGGLGFHGKLVSVTIPASVTRIEKNAFSTCRDLMSFSVDVSNPNYSSRNGMLCSKDGGTLIVGVNGDVTIPSSMTNIGWRAFYGCRGLKSFSVDASNPSCSSRNGMLCTKDGNTLIVGVNGDVTIPTSVTSIGGRAFSYCSGLTSVTIHEGVTNINSGAFSDAIIDDGSSAMKSFSVDASNPSYSSRNRLLCSKDGKTLISGVNGDVMIPEGVTNIGDGAFCCCVGLKSVIIPSSVTSIGNWAFKGCCGLTEVTIPSSVTSIGGWAFAGCNGLTSMAIPSSVTDVGHGAFSSCSNLTLLTISSGVTNIGDRAFSDCRGLTSVTIPSSVTNIGFFAFSDCSGLESVTIPSGMADRLGAFSRCRNLKSVGIEKDGKVEEIPSDELLARQSEAERTEQYQQGLAIQEMQKRTRVQRTLGVRSRADGDSVCATNKSVLAQCASSQDAGNGAEGVNRRATVDGYYTWTYSVKNGTATIGVTDGKDRCAVAPKPTGSIFIPSKLEGVPVTGIGSSAFSYCSGLTSVTIPSGVTSIGWWAFSNCKTLTSVKIPLSVTNIGFQAFDGTPFYNNFPDGMVILGGGLLYKYKGRCPSSVTIPEGVTSIGYRAFSSCGELASVVIPSSVTNIERGSFFDCGGRKSFVVDPTNPEYSSDDGLLCSKRERTLVLGVNGDVTIPSGITSIGPCAFEGCRGLTSIPIPSSVTNIGDKAFSDCSGLTSVMIPDGVVSIGNSAFKGCSGLTSVTIPPSVTSIGQETFRNCSGLTSVTIPSSVTNIGWRAFHGCCGLTSVTIPSSVTSIGWGAFYGCNRLMSVTIPSGVTSIGVWAFEGCGGLTSVTIPSSVTNIRERAFANCSGLKSVTIPSSVTSIEQEAFRNCSGLKSVTIPSSVTHIGHSAFEGCSGLMSVTIPSSVTSIEDWAFRNCSGLTNLTIPSSVTSIGRGAFEGCSGLKSVTIPEDVTSIGNGAFRNCRELTSVTIPSSVASIGVGAFRGCSGLSSVMIPDGVTSIENGAFSDCVGLTAVTIPASMTNIADFAFSGCTELALVKVQSHVANIGRNAFRDCSGLTTVIIPSSLTNIVTMVTMPNSTMSVRGHGRFKSRAVSMKLEDAVKAVFGRAGTFLPPTNGMTTVVFEKSTAVKRNAGVRGGRPFGSGSLRARRFQRQQKAQAAAESECVANFTTNKPSAEKISVAKKFGQCDFLLNKDFKKDAKFYLCLFSASWCGPCRREMPRIAKTYTEMLKDDPDIELIHFSRDQNDEKALAWAKEHNVKFPVVKPKGGNPLDLHSRGIPHLFIVKHDGTLVEEGHPMKLFTDEKLRAIKGGGSEVGVKLDDGDVDSRSVKKLGACRNRVQNGSTSRLDFETREEIGRLLRSAQPRKKIVVPQRDLSTELPVFTNPEEAQRKAKELGLWMFVYNMLCTRGGEFDESSLFLNYLSKHCVFVVPKCSTSKSTACPWTDSDCLPCCRILDSDGHLVSSVATWSGVANCNVSGERMMEIFKGFMMACEIMPAAFDTVERNPNEIGLSKLHDALSSLPESFVDIAYLRWAELLVKVDRSGDRGWRACYAYADKICPLVKEFWDINGCCSGYDYRQAKRGKKNLHDVLSRIDREAFKRRVSASEDIRKRIAVIDEQGLSDEARFRLKCFRESVDEKCEELSNIHKDLSAFEKLGAVEEKHGGNESDIVAVVVNGKKLLQSDVDADVEKIVAVRADEISAGQLVPAKKSIANQIVRDFIVETVLVAKAKERGLVVTEAERKASEAEFLKATAKMADAPKTVEEYLSKFSFGKEHAKAEHENWILIDKLIKDEWAKQARENHAAALKKINELVDMSFRPLNPVKVQAHHILFKVGREREVPKKEDVVRQFEGQDYQRFKEDFIKKQIKAAKIESGAYSQVLSTLQ